MLIKSFSSYENGLIPRIKLLELRSSGQDLLGEKTALAYAIIPVYKAIS